MSKQDRIEKVIKEATEKLMQIEAKKAAILSEFREQIRQKKLERVRANLQKQ